MASLKTHKLSPLSTTTLLGNCHRFSSGFWWQSQKLQSVQLHKKCQILFCGLWTLQLYKINPKFKYLFPSPVVINVRLPQSPVSAPTRPTKFARYLQAQTSRGVNIATFLLPQFNSKVSPVQWQWRNYEISSHIYILKYHWKGFESWIFSGGVGIIMSEKRGPGMEDEE